MVGFKTVNEFKYEDTEIYDKEKWEKNCGVDEEELKRLESLPLREVAEKWEIEIDSYNGKKSNALGYYQHGKRIALGVKNLATWTHELCHAADDKLNTLKKSFGQDAENEIVAEVGGAVLLKILGFNNDADLGGAWEYVKTYADKDENKSVKKVMSLVDRICKCVNLILEESDEIINSENKKAA